MWKSRFPYHFIWLVAAFIVGILLANLTALPAYLLGSEDIGGDTNAISALTQTFPLPFLILALGALAPVTEELVFRGILVGRMFRKVPGAVCIIVSSLAFGLI